MTERADRPAEGPGAGVGTGRGSGDDVFRLAVQAVEDGLWDWDVSTGDVFFSSAWCRILGLPPEDRVGKVSEWETRVHPADLSGVEKILGDHLEGRTASYESLHRLKGEDGTWRWILDRGRVIERGADGRPLRMIGTHTDLTRWRRMEETLRERETQAAALLEALPDMMFVNARDGTYLAWHAPRGARLAAAPDTFMGRRVADVFEPDLARLQMERIEATLASGEMQVYEYDLPVAGGTHRFEGRMVPSGSEQVLTVVRDVTEIRAAEKALARSAADLESRVAQRTAELSRAAGMLKESQGRFVALLDNIPDLAWLKDEQGRFLAVNRPFAKACGLDDPRALRGKSDLDIWPRELAESYLADDREVMALKAVKRVEEPIADSQGKWSWIETVKTPILNDRGVVVGTCGIARDVSARHEAARLLERSRDELERQVAERTAALEEANVRLRSEVAERRQAEEALRVSEARNSALLDAIPDLIFLLDRAGKILDVRATVVEDLVAPRSEVVGRFLGEILPPDVAEKTLAKIADCLVSGRPVTFDYVLPLPSGAQTFEARLAPAGEGEVVAVARNISERARLEQMKSDFVNRAAHELRTPLSTITLMVDLIREGGEPDEVERYWGILGAELKRQQSLVETLLVAGRIERGVFEVELGASDLRRALEEAIAGAEPLARNRKVALRASLPDGPLRAAGGRGPLVQVLGNFLGNAVKYTPAGGEVLVTVLPAEGGVTIAIRDTGIGIPPEDVPHVFERFFRARNAVREEIPGTGMGLFIARSIVEKIGGRIRVESEPGRGSLFEVFLPEQGE